MPLRWRKRSVPELQAVVVPEPLILSRLQYPVPELQAVVVPAAPVLRQYPNGHWCNVLVASALAPLLLKTSSSASTSPSTMTSGR